MYTEKEFTELEQQEFDLTEEAIAAMLLVVATARGNIEKELRDFYHMYGKDGVVTYAEARKWVSDQNHQRRLTALNLYITGEFLSMLGGIKPRFEKMLKSVIGKETGFFDIDVDIDFILKSPWGADKSYWLQRLEDDIDLWNIHISADIKRSLLKRQSLDAVLSQLDKRFGSIESVLRTLGLSESTAIGSLTREKIFRELGITKYQFFTRPDERRCETCGAMHGLVFPISAYEVGVTASPIHPRCRCWEVPVVD